ncbi:MAG TPA: SpoIIE family protein phosphatase, partial [Tenuifilaceae bacterium]|nr:SpoIIE family protein phosphatase [Tenuifilaceae bacterium]HRX32549.1 SpoIIE family protein phosphatase [Tenuifilaceae bacterium]
NAMFFNYAAPYFEKEEDITFSHYLEGSDEEGWSHWEKKPEATYTNLREGKYIFHVKAKNIYGDESVEAIYAFEIRPPWYRSILAYVLYVIFFILFVWGIVKWNTRRLIAEKERLEQIVKERTAEVVAQKEEIEDQKEQISAQNEEITSSIQYASRIQTALLTPNEQINQMFPDNFILFLPRDIVSGDFYFFAQVGSKKLAVAADCTGHGVPGGFMSMLGVSFLTQIISEDKTLNAGEILNKLRSLVIKALHQTSEIGGSKDGMDIALYLFDEEKMTVEFAGANNPLIVIRDDEIIQVKGDKMPIGIHLKGEIPFTNNVVEVQKNDVLYTFSDGYADQFGGENGRKFMIKNLKELFLQIHTKPMDEQREILDTTLKNWHGDSPRIDDVVVIGVRIV